MNIEIIDPFIGEPLLEQAEQMVYNYLRERQLAFIAYHHLETPTAEHVAHLEISIRGRHCKNLFLRNSKGDQLFMLIAPHDLQVNLRAVARQINSTRLSFADAESMLDLLGLEPGSVSPFGLLNDLEHQITLLLDKRLFDYDFINFHPNVNTATISLSFNDFLCFIKSLGRTVTGVDSGATVE